MSTTVNVCVIYMYLICVNNNYCPQLSNYHIKNLISERRSTDSTAVTVLSTLTSDSKPVQGATDLPFTIYQTDPALTLFSRTLVSIFVLSGFRHDTNE